ncbi:ABC transporter permease [Nitrincola iocasae]|uniref:ABC transporter permease n=1 Tax=Nitrincola iocasae TaxID=2614693 RepID=A0A5J6LD47_9GAMM|nr:ABC transporter permease [Nitrincola iocasae]
MQARNLLLLLCLIAVTLHFSDWPQIQMSNQVLTPPSIVHWLGTDSLGQDVWLRLLEALPNTLLIALACGLLPLLIGLLLATLSRFGGSLIDRILLKITDILLLIPNVLPLMILAALLEPSLSTVIVLISLLSWQDDFRVLRAAIKRQLLSDAVLYAQSFSAGAMYLLRRHIWPPLSPLMVVLFLQNARRAVMLSAALAFLGLTDPRLPSWGGLLLDAQEQIHNPAFWWLLPGPLLAMTGLILLLNSSNSTQDPVF